MTKKKTTNDLSIYEKLDLKQMIEIGGDDINFDTKINIDEKKELIEMCGHRKTIAFLVDQYYQSQSYSIKYQNQMRSLIQGYDEAEIDHPEFIKRGLSNAMVQESLNKKYMDIITNSVPICQWMRSIYGIGPVFAAYLYSVFDVEKAQYPTEFLSYAGLNDNNNPWLGETKASALVNEVLKWRDEKITEVEQKIKEWIGDDKKFTKFKTQIKRHFKCTSDVYCMEIDPIIHELDIEGTILDLYREYSLEIDEWCNLQAHSDYVGDLVFSRVSMLTKRKQHLIKKSIEIAKLNASKKKKYVTSAELKSYLAKPPYNINLKKRCYLIGLSFMKQCNRKGSLYGQIYKDRKMTEMAKNDNGDYKAIAENILTSKNWTRDTETKKHLLDGRLSPAHIDARARRYAVKLFISHVHEAMYYDRYRKVPPAPYIISHLEHHDYIAPEVDYHEFLD